MKHNRLTKFCFFLPMPAGAPGHEYDEYILLKKTIEQAWPEVT